MKEEFKKEETENKEEKCILKKLQKRCTNIIFKKFIIQEAQQLKAGEI